MASPKGPVATEAPPFSSSTVSQPSPISAQSIQDLQADASRATAHLKRAREGTPTSPSSAIATQLTADYSPSKVAKLAHLASIRSPAPLTGAAAIEDERRREEEDYRLRVSGASENPAYKVQEQLMSAGSLGLSRPQDAPISVEALPAVSMPTTTVNESEPKADTSPTTTSMSGASGAVAASPAPMDIDPQLERAGYVPQPQAQMEEKESISLSYPGLVSAATAATTQMPAPPPRGSSVPMTPGQQAAPKSPNSKKHKCPYCETEFTRHHNLKSHLLTHSQEKPYACNICSMRFRRLHDLKRHSKLHTGEKPHVCPKCDRKFARGDALARHSKGPGGCVSRRGSMFGDDDFQDVSQLEGDSSMSGVVYDGGNEADLTEEDRRRLSLPNPAIKAQHVQGTQAVPEGYASHSRTYPPPATAAGRLFSSHVEHGLPSSAISGATPTPGNLPLFSQTGMTDSPKPLESPGQAQDSNINRQRSPSLATQFQQQQFGRHQADRQTPPVPGFVASDSRYATESGTQGAAETAQASVPVQGSAPQAISNPGANGESGDGSTNNMFATDQGIWEYIHNLEENIKELSGRVATLEQTERSQEERIVQLTDEVTILRAQLETKADVTVPEPAIS